MNIKILIVIITIISAITLGCVDSNSSNQQSDSHTIELVKTETIDNVVFKVFHDNEYSVTCWHMRLQYSHGEAGNCISDSELNRGD